MSIPTILITGGTGTFGKLLTKKLIDQEGHLILLARKPVSFPDHVSNTKIKIVLGDLSQENLGLDKSQYQRLQKTVTHILHAAAATRFDLPLETARKFNVETTRNILGFALGCSRLQRLAHVSTAYIAGKRTGRILETELVHNEGFLNTYEQSKYEAEILVRDMGRGLPLAILRPSLIYPTYSGLHGKPRRVYIQKPSFAVANSSLLTIITSGHKASNHPISVLNLGLYLLGQGWLPVLPGKESDRLDVIGGETAADRICTVVRHPELTDLTYHITSAQDSPTLGELVSLAQKQVGKKLSLRFCGDMANYTQEVVNITRFRPDLKLIYKKTETWLPELAYPKLFDNTNCQKVLKQ